MARPTKEAQLQVKRELNEKQVSYVIWAAMPEGVRQPATVEEFCLAIGISRQSLWRWQKDPVVQDAIRHVVVQNAGKPEYVSQVLDMIKDAALDTKARVGEKMKAAEIWLRATGVMNTMTRSNPIFDGLDAAEGFADFSDETLEMMRQQAAATAAEMERIEKARRDLAQSDLVDVVL